MEIPSNNILKKFLQSDNIIEYRFKISLSVIFILFSLNGLNNFFRYSQIENIFIPQKNILSFFFTSPNPKYSYDEWEKATWMTIHDSKTTRSK